MKTFHDGISIIKPGDKDVGDKKIDHLNSSDSVLSVGPFKPVKWRRLEFIGQYQKRTGMEYQMTLGGLANKFINECRMSRGARTEELELNGLVAVDMYF